jgi:hypothetical protein
VPQAPPATSAPGAYGAPPAAPTYAGAPQGAPPPPPPAPPPNAGYNWAPPPAAPGAAPAEPEPRGTRARTHDGFYLQFALGVGYVSANAESQGSGGVELELTGVGQLGQLAIGGTIAPGLVLGGGIYGVNVFAGSYAYGPKDADFNEIESDAEFSAASMIGPFVAYYFDPEQGAYLVGAPAYTVVSGGKSKDGRISESSGSGFGLMLGAGYDAWVGDQWSVGAMARFQYFSAELEDDDDNKVDFTAIVPGALFTVTYH